MKRILLLEDDPVITKGLRFTFESEGFALLCCDTVAEAEAALGEPFSAAITDLMLPDGSGETLVRLMKERLPDVPVLVLTAIDDEADAVRLLDAGADDYVIKPFRARELVSRVNNLMRRYRKGGEIVEAAGLRIDPEAERVWRGDGEICLSALEYRILLLLVQSRGQTVPRERILERIWDLAGNFVNDNTLTVYVKRIREKVGENVIVTVKGIGYRVD